MKGNPTPGEADHVKSHAIMVTVQDTASKEILSDAKVHYRLSALRARKKKAHWSGPKIIMEEAPAQRKRGVSSAVEYRKRRNGEGSKVWL
jgi:hypothetical protein